MEQDARVYGGAAANVPQLQEAHEPPRMSAMLKRRAVAYETANEAKELLATLEGQLGIGRPLVGVNSSKGGPEVEGLIPDIERYDERLQECLTALLGSARRLTQALQ